MGLTRFKNRDGSDGPVSGALQSLPLAIWSTGLASTLTHDSAIAFPAGMKMQVTDVIVYSGTVVGTAIVSIGTSVAGTEVAKQTYAASATARALAITTVKSYTPAAAGELHVTVVLAAGETMAGPVTVNAVGYVSEAPTTVRQTTGSGTSNYR